MSLLQNFISASLVVPMRQKNSAGNNTAPIDASMLPNRKEKSSSAPTRPAIKYSLEPRMKSRKAGNVFVRALALSVSIIQKGANTKLALIAIKNFMETINIAPENATTIP